MVWGGVGCFLLFCMLLYLWYVPALLFCILQHLWTPGVFFQDPQNDPKTILNNSKTIPKIFQNNPKTIPKRSQHVPQMYIGVGHPQPHSRPSAHIHPSGEGRRSLRAAG